MPAELALLPIVESAYDPFAYSSGKAAGLWQFIPKTGAFYGLKQNHWYDGRRDLIDSTEAALTYLSHLHQRFDNDWLLALAAYNCGATVVNRAIKKNRRQGKPTDYWSLDLPRETEHYVPKLLAAREIILKQEQYGFIPITIANQPAFTIISTEQKPLSLRDAAKLANVSLNNVRRFNPGFKRDTLSHEGPQRLLIPIEQSERFISSFKDHIPRETALWHHHKVERGDNLTRLATRYGTSIHAIRQANQLEHDRIVINQSLMIPKSFSLDP